MKYIIRLFILIFFLTSCDYSLYNPFVIIEENSPLKILGDVRITNDASISNHASIIWTGTEYGVCWSDDRDGNSEIYFARISSSGSKIGTDNRITNSDGHSVTPSLVWTGTEYGVSWEDSRDSSREIYFARISASGVKQGSDVRVTNYVSEKYYPSLVWTGTEYGVCWEDYINGDSEIYFAMLDASGTKIGADVRLTNAIVDSRAPSLVWTGTEYGVSWHDDRDLGDFEIYFARIDASGAKIGSDIRITNDNFSSTYVSLVWTGTGYGVSWQDDRDGNYQIYFARIDSSGNKIGTDDVRITNAINEGIYPSLVWTGTGYGVSWQDNRDGNYQIYFARIDSLGNKIGSDIRITNVPFDSLSPSLVRNGNGYGISWCDERDLNDEIYYVKLSSTGTKL